jgi:nicotinamide-nucleotide amidase
LAAIPTEHLVDAEGRALPEAVFALLKGRGETLSVAESCTGGGLAHLLTETPGSSSVFSRGFVTYANDAKMELLGVSSATLEAFGAVSEETALAMAAGCRERSGTDYACAITGIAGPDGGSPDKPVGTVWISIASRQARHARRFHFRGDRETIRQRSAYAALNQIRLFVQGRLS